MMLWVLPESTINLTSRLLMYLVTRKAWVTTNHRRQQWIVKKIGLVISYSCG